MVAIGTIVWLSSELMFFAALFAMYFTLRAVNIGTWREFTEILNIPFATVNTIILVLSSVTCQLGVFAAERGDVKGLRRWFIITFLMGAFFIGLGGFDQHDDHLNAHGQLMSQLSPALRAFYDATVELGVQNSVTTFTGSDFGRTLTTNGNGSDHGWGSHHLVIGGAVQGRRIYGQMPNLALNGPDDGGDGRIVPTLSTDQYSATLARWFGAANSDLDLLFPNLGNFSQRNLGFV